MTATLRIRTMRSSRLLECAQVVRPQWSHDLERPFDSVCCWPGCQAKAGEPPRIPMCQRHLIKAWRIVNDEHFWMFRATEDVRPPTVDQGYVYLVRFRDRVKIGYSTVVKGRIGDLPHDEVLAIVPGTRRDEAQCHAAFAHLREQGEWFRAEQDLLDFAADLAKQHPTPVHLVP